MKKLNWKSPHLRGLFQFQPLDIRAVFV